MSSTTMMRPDAVAVRGGRRGAGQSDRRERYLAGLSAPERSLAQRMEALQRANDVRSCRAQLKRDLKSGRKQVTGLIEDPPAYLRTAKVFDLLLATPKYGRVKVNKLLSQCQISPSKTVGGLSDRQRGELVRLIWRRG